MRWFTLLLVLGLLAYSFATDQDFDDEGIVTDDVEVI